MHSTQKAILDLIGDKGSISLNLTWIGRDIGEPHPQNVKYHLQQLEKKGFIAIDFDTQRVIRVKDGVGSDSLAPLPVYGTANCGSATLIAEDNIEGFLKVSKKLLQGLKKNLSSLIVLRASGDSMNKATIQGESIEDGDFVIIDTSYKFPKSGDYVVSIIDGCANIKRYFEKGEEIALVSESKDDYFPIYIHEGDNYSIAGEAVRVIKKPQLA